MNMVLVHLVHESLQQKIESQLMLIKTAILYRKKYSENSCLNLGINHNQ